jgi:hypothetical protein
MWGGNPRPPSRLGILVAGILTDHAEDRISVHKGVDSDGRIACDHGLSGLSAEGCEPVAGTDGDR